MRSLITWILLICLQKLVNALDDSGNIPALLQSISHISQYSPSAYKLYHQKVMRFIVEDILCSLEVSFIVLLMHCPWLNMTCGLYLITVILSKDDLRLFQMFAADPSPSGQTFSGEDSVPSFSCKIKVRLLVCVGFFFNIHHVKLEITLLAFNRHQGHICLLSCSYLFIFLTLDQPFRMFQLSSIRSTMSQPHCLKALSC